jgi:hypothetical protein
VEIANLPQETDLLKKVEVRLLRDDERERFDQLLCERHYLHSACLVGQGLRYVAEFQGQWVALLTFSAAALHLKAREQSILMSAISEQLDQKLGYAASNLGRPLQ